jgi:Cu+-exporting ATPase
VEEVRTAIGARKAVVAYHPDRIQPDAIREAIRGLGMTITDTKGPDPGRRRSLPDLLGWGFVSVVALVALVGIAGERLGLVEALTDRIPWWVALAAVLAGGYPIFRNVGRALRNRSVTSHALMTLGIVGAIAISQYAAAAVIVFFMRLADFLEGYTTERARQAIKELLKLAPDRARVERDGREVEIPPEQVTPGEVVVIKPGERIPVDGTVLEGRASVDQASITGEFVPVEKQPGDAVFAATICERGALRLRTERVGRDTTFGQIVRLVEEAEASKAPVQRFADRFTAYYIPVVVVAAVLTYLIGGSATAAVATVLVACSCAIAMATPVTVLAAVGRAARQGIIVKGGRYLETLAKVDTIVMDKTGTLTIGRPEVTDVLPLDGGSEGELLALAASVERRSEHPLAAGILRAAERRGLAPSEPMEFEVYPGEGVLASVDGARALCGTEQLMARGQIDVPATALARVQALAAEGKSVVLVALGNRLLGLIALADTLRSEVPGALDALRALGIRRMLLLSGDRRQVAAAMAERLGVDFEAEVLPEQKIRMVARLQQTGHVVAMVGDGINDAPALAQADVGIAMGAAGTDAAIEAAHVALMQDDWRVVPEAIQIGRRAFRTIKQNLWFTAAYNLVGILLAATGWLPPIAAAAAQSLPDVVVMLNSSRLLRSR